MDLHWLIRNSTHREYIFIYKEHWTRCVFCRFDFFWGDSRAHALYRRRVTLWTLNTQISGYRYGDILILYKHVCTLPIDISSNKPIIIIFLNFKIKMLMKSILVVRWKLYTLYPMTPKLRLLHSSLRLSYKITWQLDQKIRLIMDKNYFMIY